MLQVTGNIHSILHLQMFDNVFESYAITSNKKLDVYSMTPDGNYAVTCHVEDWHDSSIHFHK